jgi:hypothetical protein
VSQEINKVARDMRDTFMREYRQLQEEIRREQADKQATGSSCVLCGASQTKAHVANLLPCIRVVAIIINIIIIIITTGGSIVVTKNGWLTRCCSACLRW